MPKTDMWTYFTRPTGETLLIYSAEEWVRLRVELLDAGPVDIGTRQEIGPVLSGNGISLVTGEEEEFDLPKGDRLYVVAANINRVKIIIQPIPWMAQILAALTGGFQSLLTGKGERMSPEAPPQAPPSKYRDLPAPTEIRHADLAPFKGRARGGGRRRR